MKMLPRLWEEGGSVRKKAVSVYEKLARTLTALRSPAPISTAKSMIWLFQSLTLVFCLDPGNTVSQTSSTPLIVNGTLGESVTLPLKFPEEEKIMSITWLHDGKSIIFIRPNKAQSPLIHVTDPKQSNRLNVTKSYSLQLSNLTMADTGSYTAQITTTSVVFYSYYLRIFSESKLGV